jgi:transcription termination factor Rho
MEIGNNSNIDQYLDNLGIYELRVLGREVGVKSPTSLKHDVLRDKIKSIVLKEEKPYYSQTRQGRPPKINSGVQEIMNNLSVISKDFEDFNYANLSKNNNENPNIVAQSLSTSYNSQDIGPIESCGIVDILVDGSGYVYPNRICICKKIFIAKEVINSYKLMIGDEISFVADYSQDRKEYAVSKINLINDFEASSNKRLIDIDSLSFDASNQKQINLLNFGGNENLKNILSPVLSAKRGDRIIIDGSNRNVTDLFLYRMLNNICQDDNLKVIFLALDENKQNIKVLEKDTNIKIYHTTFGASNFQNNEITKLVVEHIKRLMEYDNQNIVFVFKTPNRYVKSNLIENDLQKRDVQKLVNNLKQNFDLSISSKNSSLTQIYVLSDENDELNNFINKEFIGSENIRFHIVDELVDMNAILPFDLRYAFRKEFSLNAVNQKQDIESLIGKYLSYGNYVVNYSKLEELLCSSNNQDEFIKKLNANIDSNCCN